jgi:signal transduction histidine kinase
VRVSVARADGGEYALDAAGTVVVEVSDDGPGIPEGEFSPIADGGEGALDHGSGIGLWIVSWSVAAVGGELHVDTGDGGTTVAISLPAADGA